MAEEFNFGDLVLRPQQKIDTVAGPSIVEHIEVDTENINIAVLSILDYALSKKMGAIVTFQDSDSLKIALSDPSNLVAMDDLKYRFNPREVIFFSAERDAINTVLNKWAKVLSHEAEQKAVNEFNSEHAKRNKKVEIDEESGRMNSLMAKMLEQAVLSNASDIHIEPNESEVVIRFRVDGVLVEHTRYPVSLANSISNYFKVQADMEVADRRKPQDGRFGKLLGTRAVDFRVVTLPTAKGPEGLVLRIFDQSRARLSIEQVGFHEHLVAPFIKALNQPHGMILVTGPTGSGKTTTLYASLGLIATPDRKVLTIEDPVEIKFQGITQVQVNEEAGLTFTSALRSFLRADPDIMLVGEIRDGETANLAAQAALTGHLVLSTLHTNEASGAPTRLINLGLESFIISSALKAVLAQRLMRKLCEHCAMPYEVSEEELLSSRWPAEIEVPNNLWRASKEGCSKCDHVGYKGRLVVGELIVVGDEIASAIVERKTSAEIEKVAISGGSKSLHYDAILWVSEGKSSLEEVKRAGV